MKTLLSILLTLNIISPLTASGVNSTGNTAFNNMIQISYEYGIEELSVEFAGSIGVPDIANVEASVPVPLIYTINIRCNFRKPVDSATFTINLSSYDTYRTPNVIGEYCYINSVSPSQISITAYNTDFCYIKYIYSYADIHALYGYDRNLDTQTQEWVDNGSNYVSIVRYNLSACSFTESPNYTTQLSSILNSVDGIEGLLTTIRNNTSYLSTISTNIDSINSVITSINNKIDNLNTLNWNNISSSWVGYTTDLTNYNTTDNSWYDAGYFVWVNNITNEQKKGMFKIIIPIRNVSMDNLKFYQIWSGVLQEFTIEKYVFFYNRENTTIYFYLNDHYGNAPNGNYRLAIECNKRTYIYNANDFYMGYMTQDDTDYWTLYSTINQFMELEKINNSLNQIISILGTTDISVTDEQNKQTVDNKFNELLQNLTLPQVPERPTKVPFMKSLFGIFGDIINTPGLDMAKWFIGIEAIVMLMGVILK